MKTEVWVYSVLEKGRILWQSVFDCEVSDARVIDIYRKEMRDQVNIVIIQCEKRILYRETPEPVTIIPEVQPGVLCALEQNMRETDWFRDELVKFSLSQPVLREYLRTIETTNEVAALVGVVIYNLIESQIEADQL